ncbi:hypothetical protein BgAZ_402940 [Babesia gibsoni]|uniref:Uncharacterized protein n=1 Tax=Babesia gibsoni TaxID=33632 RepID=A0AAD8PD27_BABGI|nr:hypothetical protein BgAZ_402940 [Babesia gibsoni]
MRLCIEEPEVFQLPRSLRHLQSSRDSDGCISDCSSIVTYNPSDPPLEKLIKVRVTLCQRYLYVLTSQVLHVYSNLHSNVHLGRFTLDDDLYHRYGAFRDIVFIPGWRSFCLLMEKQKRVLVCTYDVSGLGLDSTIDSEIQKQPSTSILGSARHDCSPTSSSRSYAFSMLKVQQKSPTEASTRRGMGMLDTLNIKHAKQRYEKLMEPVEIRLLYFLSLPSAVHTITFHSAQMYFWTMDQLGVYVTLCPEGFINHLACNLVDELPIKMTLNLHTTNLVQNMMASGTIALANGLCYLSMKSTIYACELKAGSPSTKLYVPNTDHNYHINSLCDWVDICCPSNGNSGSTCESPQVDSTIISPSSLSNNLASMCITQGTPLEQIVPNLLVNEIIMLAERGCCLLTTYSGALMSLKVANSQQGGIGALIYKSGVSNIVAEGGTIAANVEDQVTLLSWDGSTLFPVWKYRLGNIRSLSIYNDTIAAFYNYDGFVCFNVLGKVMLHRRSTIDDTTYQSSCFASKGLSLIATRVTKLVMFKMYATGSLEIPYSNPFNTVISFVGIDDVLLFHARMVEGTFGETSRSLMEDRSMHSYDNSGIIGDMDCNLLSVPLKSPHSRSGRWPLTHVSPSPKGNFIIGLSSSGRALYDGDWKWFEEDLGDCLSVGWLREDVCFMIHSMPVQLFIVNHDAGATDNGNKDVISLGDAPSTYCHFFHVSDLSTHLEIVPIKSRPQCCTVFDEILYILDEMQVITGYQLCEDSGSYKFNVIYHVKHDEPPSARILEIHYMDSDTFALLDNTQALYMTECGRRSKMFDGCNYITPTLSVVNGCRATMLLCSVHLQDHLTAVTSKHTLVITGHLPPAALVDEGAVSYIINLIDPRHSAHKVRIGKLLLPLNDTTDALNSVFSLDALEQVLAAVTNDKMATAADIHSRFEKVPAAIMWRLVSLQSRKRNLREEVKALEEVFGSDLLEVFNNCLLNGQESDASYMLLALQSLTDPTEVRNNFNIRLIQSLATKMSVSMSDEFSHHLFQSLLRFHNIVEDVEHVDLKNIAMKLFRKSDLMGVYKLCNLFRADLGNLLNSMRKELECMYIWGICQLQEGETHQQVDTAEAGDGKVDIANMIIAVRVALGLSEAEALSAVQDVHITARISACLSLGLLSSAKAMPYNWPTIYGHFFQAFLTEGLLLPAFAISLASADFVSISLIMAV